MSDAPDDGVTFVTPDGVQFSTCCTFAFLGVHLVGAVRDRVGGGTQAGEWISFLCEAGDGRPVSNWRGAQDLDAAKAALREHIARWYDAAHTPLAPGQGERLAGQARVG
jgi:phage/plasmid primase-like uncharacterized protein